MSDATELIRAAFEAFNRGDMEAVLAFLDPEVEVFADEVVGNAGTYRGRDGFLEWNREWMEAWDDFRVELGELEDLDGENVLIQVTQVGRGKDSGIEIAQEFVYLFQVLDGHVVRLHLYSDRESALAAAGS